MHPVVLACRRLRSRTRRAGRANGGGCISCTLRTKENVEYQTLGWCAWEVSGQENSLIFAHAELAYRYPLPRPPPMLPRH